MERPQDASPLDVAIVDVDDTSSWDRAIEAVQPARILALVDHWLDGAARQHLSAEDVWQECLLVAWSRRAQFRWQGLASFRRWLLEIAERCALDARARARTLKRGEGRAPVPLGPSLGGDSDDSAGPLFASTTPSRLAQLRESADVMRSALESLSPELRDVVRLRVFEEVPVELVAQRLGLGVSAVKHRARQGLQAYERAVRARLRGRGED